MSATTADLLTLTLWICVLLIALGLFGEAMRRRGDPDRPSPALESYLMRVQSWWAMVILLALALLLGRAGVVVLFGFASFAALREFLTLTAKAQADHIALALAFFVILPLQFVFVGLRWEGASATFIPIYAFLGLPILSALRGNPQRFLIRVAETQWGLMIAVFCVSYVPALMMLDLPDHGDRAILLIAFLVIVVQLGDLLEYFIGRRIGRRRIAPGLAPKTWEGMASGVACAAAIGAALSWITPFGPWGAAAMAAAASAAGQFGSLVMAAIKRDRGIKDWSHMIPGQGGVLDQFDSVVFAAPVFYHLARTFWG
ncbi:MAG: phosphatidate cytidylyltransferase [Limimaricola sp.]|uniref:phosphatidate cytidylyltransferase n=1 Tax=Limimaricola sp. TaxID=2211665 RepID=UPI001DAB748A|nr:phosphatidate cytidylyltransferase [Limimaricola sp.]MBI1415897.1 phosphatidate cytidylyltransferase [Limimaricola sp.]